MSVSTWRHPLSDIAFDDAEAQAVARVLASGWLTMGPEVEAFEAEFAKAHDIAHAVMVSSGTAALELSLDLIGLRPGDEVIVPAITFAATANAVVRRGGVPVFADIESTSKPLLCAVDVARKISARTQAVIAVHYGGARAEIEELRDAVGGRPVIEDAAHATGADGLGLGHTACFSFYGNKNLVTGEGGMIATNDASMAERVRQYRSHGMTRTSAEAAAGRAANYDVVRHGTNARPGEIQAAMGRVQLQKLSDHNDRRHYWRAKYAERLKDFVPLPLRGIESTGHLMLALVDDRERVRARLADAGIQTSVHYPALHRTQAYRESTPEALPVSDEYAARTLTLPLHPNLTEDAVAYIAESLREVVCG